MMSAGRTVPSARHAGCTCCTDEPFAADGLVQAAGVRHAADHLLRAGQRRGRLRLVPAHRLPGKGQRPQRQRLDLWQRLLCPSNHLHAHKVRPLSAWKSQAGQQSDPAVTVGAEAQLWEYVTLAGAQQPHEHTP